MKIGDIEQVRAGWRYVAGISHPVVAVPCDTKSKGGLASSCKRALHARPALSAGAVIQTPAVCNKRPMRCTANDFEVCYTGRRMPLKELQLCKNVVMQRHWQKLGLLSVGN